MNKHTPGPWNMYKSRTFENVYHVVRPEENCTLEICTIQLADTSREDYKNAAMIGAALDLYEALRGMVTSVNVATAAGVDTTGYVFTGKALAAIAKAEGME